MNNKIKNCSIQNIHTNDIILLNEIPYKITSIENIPTKGHIFKKCIYGINIFDYSQEIKEIISSNKPIYKISFNKQHYKIINIINHKTINVLSEQNELQNINIIDSNNLMKKIHDHINNKQNIYITLIEYNNKYILESYKLHIFG